MGGQRSTLLAVCKLSGSVFRSSVACHRDAASQPFIQDVWKSSISELNKELLNTYLGGLPKGTYHRRDDNPARLYCDGKPVALIANAPGDPRIAEGLCAALVYLLNERDTQ